MQCVILAGGLGTRMRRLTATIPKAMIPVAGEPFVRHQLRLLALAGVRDVVIATGYLGDVLADEVEAHCPPSISVRCVPDGPALRGTAGALRRLADMQILDVEFMVVYGDSYLCVDYGAVCTAFDSQRFGALMTVIRNDDALEVSNAIFADGVVTLYRKGLADPEDVGMRFVDYGLSVISLQTIRDLVPATDAHDLAHVFETLSTQSKLQGFEVSKRFFEIGSERGLADLEKLLGRKDL